MKKMLKIFVLVSLILSVSCNNNRQLIRSAEKYLLNHIGDPKSYSRIEWETIDTTYLNELLIRQYVDTLQKSNDTLQALKYGLEQYQSNILELKSMIDESKNGIYTQKSVRGRIIDLNRYRIYSNDELEKIIGSEVDFKWQPTFTIDELEKMLSKVLVDSSRISHLIEVNTSNVYRQQLYLEQLRSTILKSKIVYITLRIRFRAKLASSPQYTYVCNLKYDVLKKTFNVEYLHFDGIERNL